MKYLELAITAVNQPLFSGEHPGEYNPKATIMVYTHVLGYGCTVLCSNYLPMYGACMYVCMAFVNGLVIPFHWFVIGSFFETPRDFRIQRRRSVEAGGDERGVERRSLCARDRPQRLTLCQGRVIVVWCW